MDLLKKKSSIQEHIERMKYVSKYTINETPKYMSLIGDSEMDALPEYLMREADAAPSGDTANAAAPAPEGLPDPTAIAGGEPEAAGVAPVGAPTAEPTQAETDPNVEIRTAPATPEIGGEAPMPMGNEIPPAPEETPEKKVLELQLDALKKMSYKIEDLGASIDSLNQRMEIYSNEVEEVREPSDMEKFENRKVDSHPYYFNLNDLWDNNNFKARMDQFSKGYVKTKDGYIADFDDLDKLPPHEVKASFNDF
jgi:hypothetical protein